MGILKGEPSFAPPTTTILRHFSVGPRDIDDNDDDIDDDDDDDLDFDFDDDDDDDDNDDDNDDDDDLSIDGDGDEVRNEDEVDDVVPRSSSSYGGSDYEGSSSYSSSSFSDSYMSPPVSNFSSLMSTISPSQLPLFTSEKYTSSIVSLSECYAANAEDFDVEDETLLNFLKVAMDRLHFNLETTFK